MRQLIRRYKVGRVERAMFEDEATPVFDAIDGQPYSAWPGLVAKRMGIDESLVYADRVNFLSPRAPRKGIEREVMAPDGITLIVVSVTKEVEKDFEPGFGVYWLLDDDEDFED